jgi:hypothetical protein
MSGHRFRGRTLGELSTSWGLPEKVSRRATFLQSMTFSVIWYWFATERGVRYWRLDAQLRRMRPRRAGFTPRQEGTSADPKVVAMRSAFTRGFGFPGRVRSCGQDFAKVAEISYLAFWWRRQVALDSAMAVRQAVLLYFYCGGWGVMCLFVGKRWLALALLGWLLSCCAIWSEPAAAQGALPAELEICLCRELAARFLCKSPAEIELLGPHQTGIYVFNVFYASKYSNFLCGAQGGIIRIYSRDMLRQQGAMEFRYDEADGCAVGRRANPECRLFDPEIRCCKQQMQDDQRQQLEDQFWDRPVPKDLPAPGQEEKSQPGAGSAAP